MPKCIYGMFFSTKKLDFELFKNQNVSVLIRGIAGPIYKQKENYSLFLARVVHRANLVCFVKADYT